MTDSEKAVTVAAFLRERDRDPRRDPEMWPFCDRVNRVPGVCTVYSCVGHGGRMGFAWIALSGVMQAAWKRNGWRLRPPAVYSVRERAVVLPGASTERAVLEVKVTDHAAWDGVAEFFWRLEAGTFRTYSRFNGVSRG